MVIRLPVGAMMPFAFKGKDFEVLAEESPPTLENATVGSQALNRRGNRSETRPPWDYGMIERKALATRPR